MDKGYEYALRGRASPNGNTKSCSLTSGWKLQLRKRYLTTLPGWQDVKEATVQMGKQEKQARELQEESCELQPVQESAEATRRESTRTSLQNPFGSVHHRKAALDTRDIWMRYDGDTCFGKKLSKCSPVMEQLQTVCLHHRTPHSHQESDPQPLSHLSGSPGDSLGSVYTKRFHFSVCAQTCIYCQDCTTEKIQDTSWTAALITWEAGARGV